eukprot:Sspe_Gene.65803::Locus_38903_Transcript_2_2_Confidence_0.667_Length_1435::g.65803::m.65803/K14997/SLC38A11; solute carrier family 38 (sodium-coupled neutral amino acid transporter), member 11
MESSSRRSSFASVRSHSSVGSYAVRPTEVIEHSLGVLGGTVVMVNTVVGGGISLIATPNGVRELGLGTFFATEAVFGMLTFTSLYTLALLGTTFESMHYNLKDILTRVVGRWAGLLGGAMIFLNNFGVMIAFLQTGKDVCNVIVGSEWGGLMLGLLILLITPAACFPHVDRIALLATVCALLWVIFVLILIANLAAAKGDGVAGNGGWVWAEPIRCLVGSGLPLINLTWTCQFNALPLFGSLEPRDLRSMAKVSGMMSGVTTVLYCAFGTAVYLYYGRSIRDDIMLNIDPNRGGQGLTFPRSIAVLTEVLLGTAIIGTVPLFLIEARNMLHSLFFPAEASPRLRIAETLAILATCFGIAIGFRNITLIMSLIGVIPANIIAWFLPGLAVVTWWWRTRFPAVDEAGLAKSTLIQSDDPLPP